jgi:16S rRNA (adenine1518-N6/adenine1519-N6)-dimethyltransferase
VPLLGPAEIRQLARNLGIRPTKTLGQNFVHDAGTVRRIVRTAGVQPGDFVLEIGPGLGSLTLALLEAGAHVTAVEIDGALAAVLRDTVGTHLPEALPRLAVLHADALAITGPQDLPVPESLAPAEPDVTAVSPSTAPTPALGASTPSATNPTPTKLVANLPYNVATPVLLTLLEALPDLTDILVMVQAEVADRLAEPPGSRTYGSPSAKAAWYGTATRAGTISRSVFWPEPNVDSALVRLTRTAPPDTVSPRHEVFRVVDAAFSQRRKTLRAALATWAGSPARAEQVLTAAGIDPTRRGETLHISEFAAIAAASSSAPTAAASDDAASSATDSLAVRPRTDSDTLES